ncbi:MAG: amidase family protein [Burkholderiaceae bacterium]
MEDGILGQAARALHRLESLGAIIEPMRLPYPVEKLWQTWLVLRQGLQGGALSVHYNNPARRPLLKPEAVWEIESAMSASAVDFYQASVARTEFFHAMRTAFDGVDLFALPTAQVFPFDVGTHWPAQIAGRQMDTYHRWMEVVLPATVAGLPAISVPVPMSADERAAGRISGLQLIGPPRADAAVLAAAIAYDEA